MTKADASVDWAAAISIHNPENLPLVELFKQAGICWNRQAGVEEPFITVKMPCCEQRFEYPTLEDFPKETMPCPCGAENRWVVFYEEA